MAYVGQTSATPANNPTSGSWTLPGGWAAGDIGVFRWYTFAATKTLTAPGTVTVKYNVATAGSGRLVIGYRWLQAGDSTFAWTSSSVTGSTTVWGVAVFRGATQVGDPFEADSGAPAAFVNAVSPTAPAATPIRSAATAVTIFGKADDYTSIAAPAGYTLAGSGSSTAGNDASSGLAYREGLTSQGTVVAVAWSLGGGATTNDGLIWTGIIEPAATGSELIARAARSGETTSNTLAIPGGATGYVYLRLDLPGAELSDNTKSAQLTIERSTDGGVSWQNVGAIGWVGSVMRKPGANLTRGPLIGVPAARVAGSIVRTVLLVPTSAVIGVRAEGV